jgi:hypothetical protein
MPKNLSPGVAMLTMTLLLTAGCADVPYQSRQASA